MASESNAFRHLLDEILAKAGALGIDQRTLAKRAGITPETLSRMKGRGSGDFSVLNAMARVVGLHLALAPDDETLKAIETGTLF